eukprot:GHVU01137039.1.p2 GENE.GHVU01137039.1~~GHVU01137039.1.p2  ORF type:complete len:321 (-),score=21.62 GHVU01137039.1:1764-2726(-)
MMIRLAQFFFAGADGTDLTSYGATITAFVDGTPGSNDMPGRLVFATTADGAAGSTNRMTINSNGDVMIGTQDPGYPAFADNLTVADAANSGITIRSGTSGQGNIYFSDATGTGGGTFVGYVSYTHANDQMAFQAGGTVALTLAAAGAATLANGLTLTDGNLVVAAGHGIDFSATSDGSGTATSELLSDYEEGTFTPAFAYSTAGNSSFGYSAQVGYYVKVGDIVHFQTNVRLNAFTKGTGSGSFLLYGLPYTAHNTGGYAHAQVSISLSGWTFSNIPVSSVIENAAYCHINTMSSNASAATIADPDSDSMVWVSGTYRAA